jgi:uncharacterized protein (TIGR00369 family)
MIEQKAAFFKMIQEHVSTLPFHRFLGLDSGSFDMEKGRIHFDMRDELVGNPHFKILHGGVIATILDIEAGMILVLDGAWHSETASAASPFTMKGGTIDLRVDYLRPGKGKRFVASGAVLRRGNKVAVVHTELRNEQDELIATGTATYLVG